MTPALLLPAALGALAALAIPLVIHIARRTESRTVDFAALRWLDPRAKPRRRPRIDERLLLLVRLLLLTLLALWLAEPVLWGVRDTRAVVAVAPGANLAAISGVDAQSRVVWLAPGFPKTDVAPPSAQPNLMSLIRQLDAELPAGTPLTLVVPTILEGVDAERPTLTRRVIWRIVPPAGRASRPAVAAAPVLTIRHASSTADSARYFRAAAAALSTPGAPPATVADVSEPVGREAGQLIWLAPGSAPERILSWIGQGHTALIPHDAEVVLDGDAAVVWRDEDGAPLATAGPLGRGRVVQLLRAVQPAALPQLLEPNFPDVLARLLAPPPAPARVAATDHAPLSGARPYVQPPYDLRPWLAVLIALVLVGERWLATRRSRASIP